MYIALKLGLGLILEQGGGDQPSQDGQMWWSPNSKFII